MTTIEKLRAWPANWLAKPGTMIAAGWPRRRMSAEKLPKAVMNQADTIQRYRGDRSIPNAATS